MPEQRASIRVASWVTFAVGALAFINPHVTAPPGEWAAIWGGWLLGFTLMAFSGVHIWTARQGRPLFGSRVLSLFNLALGVTLAAHGFLLRLPETYAWSSLALGAIVVVVEVFDAIRSPGSRWTRRGSARL